MTQHEEIARRIADRAALGRHCRHAGLGIPASGQINIHQNDQSIDLAA